MADPFLAALWDLHDREKAERRTTPRDADGFPTSSGDSATEALLVIHTDPATFMAGRYQHDEARLRALVHGERNDGLNRITFGLGRLVAGGLAERDAVEAWLWHIVEDAWPDLDAGNVAGTIKSGLDGGAGQPQEWEQRERPPRTPDNPVDPFDPFDTGLVAAPATSAVQPGIDPVTGSSRRLVLTKASSIVPRPVHWLWEERIPLGHLTLLGGREGIGKSTLAYTLAAQVTRGTMAGHHYGTPKSVIVAATEDSWAHTIVPRLMAANADLELVYRVDVVSSDGLEGLLSLPRDLVALEDLIRENDVALLLLDPLMSRLDASLDSHKDGEVRRALEPLVAIVDRTGCVALGLIHVNKSMSSDPLTALMASRAFAAVARAVLFVMRSPDDESLRLLGTPKSNLGRDNLPTLVFAIESVVVAQTEDGDIVTGRLEWRGETDISIAQALESLADGMDVRSAVDDAAGWLHDFLTSQGGQASSKDTKSAGNKAGHSDSSVKKAAKRLKLVSRSTGFPRSTYWELAPDGPFSSGVKSLGRVLTEPTEPTDENGQPEMSSGFSGVSWPGPREVDPTGEAA